MWTMDMDDYRKISHPKNKGQGRFSSEQAVVLQSMTPKKTHFKNTLIFPFCIIST